MKKILSLSSEIEALRIQEILESHKIPHRVALRPKAGFWRSVH
jgi:hypothetical protein